MLARFIQCADGLARQLDRAHGATFFRWPLVADLRLLEFERNLLRTAAVGRDGVEVCKQAAQAVEQLAAAVKAHDAGDLAPWRTSRDTVRGILAGLRELLIEPETDADVAGRPEAVTAATPGPMSAVADVELVVRTAAVAAPLPLLRKPASTPAPRELTGSENGQRGENGLDVPDKLSQNCRRILRLLKDEGATRRDRGWTFEGLRDETRLSDGQIRRAMDALRKYGLYASHRGQDGGVWLTPLGVEIAERISRP